MSRWDEILRRRSFVCDLPGAELERFPFLSGYGLAFRITRLTALCPNELKSALGVRGAAFVDLLSSTRRTGRSLIDFVAKLGLTGSGIDAYWTEDAWSPVQLHGAWNSRSHPVRHCPVCARYGYHTMLFQLPSIGECPWHGCALDTNCPNCHMPNGGGFGPGGLLGVCVCGYDAFQPDLAATRMWDFPATSVSAWMEAYLGWAQVERPLRHLVVRPGSEPSDWGAGFATLAAPPAALIPPPTSAGVDTLAFDAAIHYDPNQRHFWGWSQPVGDRRPLTYFALPADVRPALAAATARAIAALPETSTSPRILHGSEFAQDEALVSDTAIRSDCYIAPFGDGADELVWVNLSAVDPRTLAVCDRLVHGIAERLGALQITSDRSLQTARSQAIDRVWGRGALANALRELLARGYQQGFEAIMRSHIGRPWPAERPWLEPVVEYQGRGHTLESIRIAWAPCRQLHFRGSTPTTSTLTRPGSPSSRKRMRKSTTSRPAGARRARPAPAQTR